MVQDVTWIVVADGARARIFSRSSRHRRGEPLVPALDHDLVASRALDSELDSDRPGRTNARTERMRHGLGHEDDSHRHAQQQLARDVARELEHARTQGLRAVILIAPPRALGDLREACNEHVRALVSHELAKDLSTLAVHELAPRIDALFVPE